jgi:antirestriction protein ArdC
MPKELIPEDYQRVNNPIATSEKVVLEMPQRPEIKFKEQQAYYNPLQDFINMPKRNSFKDPESYYQVLFHEMIHSTGHSSRLGRKELLEMAEFGSEPYSIEELTAEMGTCYLSAHCGVTLNEFENNAAYIQNWMKVLKNDKRFVIYASGKAQQAVDFILNIQQTDREPEHSGEHPIPAE